ncbi:uncharacterized protein ARMOST_04771 [Armillaria ostoyae]|uniref:Uncharacterized protein n=1 Tax=Armillaria ostoyae TaxID=47428 RepID=A0A284QY93_ARMOS|nr:uncharacterized protein ARMOST_04771 [Armillaria ostoyae]
MENGALDCWRLRWVYDSVMLLCNVTIGSRFGSVVVIDSVGGIDVEYTRNKRDRDVGSDTPSEIPKAALE